MAKGPSTRRRVVKRREFVAAAKRLHGDDWRGKVCAELYDLFRRIDDHTISRWEQRRETIPLHVELALRSRLFMPDRKHAVDPAASCGRYISSLDGVVLMGFQLACVLRWCEVGEAFFAAATAGRNGPRYHLIAERLPEEHDGAQARHRDRVPRPRTFR